MLVFEAQTITVKQFTLSTLFLLLCFFTVGVYFIQFTESIMLFVFGLISLGLFRSALLVLRSPSDQVCLF